ncbi:MAG TPA: nitroreductase family protein [Dissulfurispiraceae bacterium]|nr:nitroreductase family protein [Dissulfurispiraceae bacterium]
MNVILALEGRRSINFFDPSKDVPEELLRHLLDLANLAPSSFNLQPWQVVVVRDVAKKRRLRECALNQPKVEEAPVVLILVADPLALEQNRERVLDSWQDLEYMKSEMRSSYLSLMAELYGTPDSEKRRLFAVKNTSLYAMSLMVAAKGLGIETHPMDGFDEECVKREFSIPPDKSVPMLIAVGYLREGVTLLPRAFRRSIEEFVRFESY